MIIKNDPSAEQYKHIRPLINDFTTCPDCGGREFRRIDQVGHTIIDGDYMTPDSYYIAPLNSDQGARLFTLTAATNKITIRQKNKSRRDFGRMPRKPAGESTWHVSALERR